MFLDHQYATLTQQMGGGGKGAAGDHMKILTFSVWTFVRTSGDQEREIKLFEFIHLEASKQQSLFSHVLKVAHGLILNVSL